MSTYLFAMVVRALLDKQSESQESGSGAVLSQGVKGNFWCCDNDVMEPFSHTLICELQLLLSA